MCVREKREETDGGGDGVWGEAGDSLCLSSSGEVGLETTGEKGIKDIKQTFSDKNV